MLELYVAPQLEEFQPWIIFQQDGAPPNWDSDVSRFSNATFPSRWIGGDGPTPWPPRPPDITPLTSFYGGMLKTKCFQHQFQILQIWRQEITDTFATITEDMLENMCREIDYRLDVLRATKGATCWSVLMCYKQTSLSWVTFGGRGGEYIYICIPRSFLVINVCNQGKNLCSPCTINLHICMCTCWSYFS